MVAARTQKAQEKARKKEEALAEATIQAEKEKAKKREMRKRIKKEGYPFTAEDIIRERDEKGLSWKQVATNLDLGSPSAARKAYTALTGVPHNQSNPILNRAPKGAGKRSAKYLMPEWNADSDQDEIIEAISGRIIHVERYRYGATLEEDFRVARVIKFEFENEEGGEEEVLTVTISDQQDAQFPGVPRTFRVSDIKGVR